MISLITTFARFLPSPGVHNTRHPSSRYLIKDSLHSMKFDLETSDEQLELICGQQEAALIRLALPLPRKRMRAETSQSV
jgi:hypothetical protein